MAVRPRTSGDAVVRFARAPDAGRGFRRLALVGVVDADGDGGAEVVLREEGPETYRYRVVAHRGGRFRDVFRGGGGGC